MLMYIAGRMNDPACLCICIYLYSPTERFSPFILGVRQTFQSPMSSPTATAVAVDLCGGVMLACYCCAVAYLTTSHA